MILINNLKQTSEKNVVLDRAQTCTSHSLGKCPNHLDHWLYMLLTVFNSPLRVYFGLVPGTLCTAICSDLPHLHHLSEDIWMHYDCPPSLVKLNSQLFYCIINNNMILIYNLKQTRERNVALGRAWTCTSYSPGKCPNLRWVQFVSYQASARLMLAWI